MLKKQIGRHPLTSWIEYHEDIPWSEADERLAVNFSRKHEKLIAGNTWSRNVMEGYSSIRKHIEEVGEALSGQVAPTIEASRAAAEHVLPGFRIKSNAFAGAHVKAFNTASETIAAFDEALAILAADLSLKNKAYEGFYELVYDYDEALTNAIRDDHALLYREAGRHAIDYGSFDSLEIQFRSVQQVHRGHWERTLQYRNETIDQYNTLLLEIRIQYAIWEEFALRCKLIGEITKTLGPDADAARN